MFYCLGVTILTLGVCQAFKLPEDWTHCSLGNEFNECMKGAVQYAVRNMAGGGLPSLGVLPLDPMHFDQLIIDQSTGPVAIKLELKNIDVTGIKDIIITDVKGDWSELKVKTLIPVPLTVSGEYVINGKVLALPIVGSGAVNLTFHEYRWDPFNLKFKEEIKKGKKHIIIDDMILEPHTSLLQMEFLNLFNGDKMLGPQMNIFLNENWNEIFNELKPPIAKVFGAAFKEIGNRIFSKISADVIMS